MKSHGEVKLIDGERVASPEYRAWQAVRNRCLNPESKDYPYYGGRGIKMHPAWNDFTVFLADVGRKPDPLLTLDRIESNGNYEPGNVRWATRQVQARNRDYAKTKAWILADRLGLKKMTVHHMIWQVRNKDKGTTKWFALSPELEQIVRDFLKESL